MHVSLVAETLFQLWWLPVTNSLLTTWLVIAAVAVFAIIFRLRIRQNPRGIQNIVEMVVEGFHGLVESVTNNFQQARKFFPIIFTIFLFVLLNNWAGLLPGVGSIGFFEETAHAEVALTEVAAGHGESVAVAEAAHAESAFTPLFRAGTADLSFTLSLAIVAVLLVQIVGISALGGWSYFGRFLNFKSPIHFFVGILEIVSEFSKIISFSFRLFGNVFAGEVLLVVMISLVPFVVPIPFYGLEIFVGAIQALVFAVLTLVFFKMATTEAH